MPGIPYVVSAVLAAALLGLAVYWFRARSRRKADREQMARKLREDALDRALANQVQPLSDAGAQAPTGVQYNIDTAIPKGTAMLRLTELGNAVNKTYLMGRDSPIYLGAEQGRAAVFRENTRGYTICAEVFSSEGSLYVRSMGGTGGTLIRGRNRAALERRGVKLHSQDIIETKYGSFRVELI